MLDYDAYFGPVGKPPIDWRKEEVNDAPDDDEPMSVTPLDVINLLGFDPLDASDDA